MTAGPGEDGAARGSRAGARAVVALALVAGIAARIAAARGDLWFDEIWSLEMAFRVPSPLAILTAIHHDNNHHLNTLYLMLVGPGAGPVAYRALAIVSGAALLGLIALRPAGVGRAHAIGWLTSCAASLVLVQYGSEARGYSTAVALAVAAFAATARWLETRRARWAAALAAAAVLGILAHLTFVFVLVALEAWAIAALVRDRTARPVRPAELAWLAAPAVALAALWAIDLRHLVVGGGPPFDALEVARALLRATFGLPRGLPEVLGGVAVAAAALEVVRLARARRAEAIFFAAVLLGPPAAVAVARPEVLAPRYFVVAVPFLLYLVAAPVARAWTRGGGARYAAAAVLAAFLATDATALAHLWREGRGTYRAAVEEIVRGSPPAARSVGSDHDYRNPLVLGWFAREVPGAEDLTYVPAGAWSPAAPVWVLHHDFEEEPHPEAAFVGQNGRRYALVRSWRTAGLSGWNWSLYRMSP